MIARQYIRETLLPKLLSTNRVFSRLFGDFFLKYKFKCRFKTPFALDCCETFSEKVYSGNMILEPEGTDRLLGSYWK